MKAKLIVALAAAAMAVTATAAVAPAPQPVQVCAPAAKNANAWLNSYEQYVNQLIALSKKVKAGDMSAMTKYTQLVQKANELQSKLQDIDDLTPAQQARLNRIVAKMAKAIR